MYRIPGNFHVAKFSRFHEFLLSRGIKFREIIACHTFYIAHVDHSRKYFLRIFISRKLSDAKISRYTVLLKGFTCGASYINNS